VAAGPFPAATAPRSTFQAAVHLHRRLSGFL